MLTLTLSQYVHRGMSSLSLKVLRHQDMVPRAPQLHLRRRQLSTGGRPLHSAGLGVLTQSWLRLRGVSTDLWQEVLQLRLQLLSHVSEVQLRVNSLKHVDCI